MDSFGLTPETTEAFAAAAVFVLLLLLLGLRLRRRSASARRRGPQAPERQGLPAEVAPAAEAEIRALAEAPRATTAERLRVALGKSRDTLRQGLAVVFGQDRALDVRLAALEEALLLADVGGRTTAAILEDLRRRFATQPNPTDGALRSALRQAVEAVLGEGRAPEHVATPWVIVVSGINGVGKTTSIGKLAHRFRSQGRSVLLVAADTFRAAAIDQLAVWAERAGADLVRHQSGADPAAVAFDGISAAVARAVDVVIVDTAGRMHTKENLMAELGKVARVIGRALAGAPHEVLLVLDATTGQNALSQAKVFAEIVGVTGVILSKLDGTAKGGAALAVRRELGVPIVYVGVGEGIEDLRPFSAPDFARALLGEE